MTLLPEFRQVDTGPAVDAVDRRMATLSLRHFAQQAWTQLETVPYVENWHLKAIAEHLEAVTDGRIESLLINIPPGCGKSLLVSVFWPVWCWLRKPETRFLCASYSGELSTRDSMNCRKLIESEWFQTRWPVRLSEDANQKTRFENTSGGWRHATSVGGAATGLHPDIQLFDDIHKVKEAESDVERQGVINWFDGTMTTRGVTRGVRRVIVMQRLHQEDIAGHVLKQGGWEHLCIPMEFETERRCVTKIGWSDPRTKEGELLWPALFTPQILNTVKTAMGSQRAAGQLQQRPAPKGGGLFKREWFDVVGAAPAVGRRVRAWDFAATIPKDGRDPDWTVGARMMMTPEKVFYLEAVRRFRGTALEVEHSLATYAVADGDEVEIQLPQDPGQAGKGQSEQFVRMLAGFRVKASRVTGSKEVRAANFAAQCEARNVKLVNGPWIEAFLDELEVFPFGAHDDQVDAAADAFNALAKPSYTTSVNKIRGL